MSSTKKLDPQLVEKIINKAEGYTRMANALTVDAAFGKAANEFLGDKNLQWGAYKKAAEKIFLNRQNEGREAKRKELLAGAEDAALARRDAEVLEAEASAEALFKLREEQRSGRK